MMKGMRTGLTFLAVFVLAGAVGFLNAQTQTVPDTGKAPKVAGPDTNKVPNSVVKTEEKHLPIWVNEAIRLGLSQKVRPYALANKFMGVSGGDEGSFTTPFLRVQIAASDAKKKFMVFGPSDVTEEMLAPVLIVTVYPIFGEKFSDTHRSAEHVVIKKQKSNDPADAIQPTTIKPYDVTQGTAGGGTITKQGLVATFPLNALKEGYEFLLIYEQAPMTGNKFYFSITKEMLYWTMRY